MAKAKKKVARKTTKKTAKKVTARKNTTKVESFLVMTRDDLGRQLTDAKNRFDFIQNAFNEINAVIK